MHAWWGMSLGGGEGDRGRKRREEGGSQG